MRILKKGTAAILFNVLLTLSLNVLAYSPLNTDDAGTLAEHSNQIELYFFMINQFDPGPAIEGAESSGENYQGVGTARAIPLVYSRGLTSNIEASFSPTTYITPKGDFSPIANYTLSMKWRYFGDGENGLNLAIKPQLILPASADQQVYGIGNAMVNGGVTAIASYFWSGAELHANLSYLRAPYNSNYMMGMAFDANRTNLYSASIAPVWVISPQIKVALDLGINTNPNEPEQSLTTYAMVAAIFSVTKDIELGLSYQRNAANYGAIFSANELHTSRVQAGVTFRFE